MNGFWEDHLKGQNALLWREQVAAIKMVRSRFGPRPRVQKRIKGKGRTAWGEFKLTPMERKEIRYRAWTGPFGIGTQLAKEFGIHTSTVSSIKHRSKGYSK